MPQSEIGSDPIALRDFVQGISDLGYHHIGVLDHVVGADRVTYGDKPYLPYDATSEIHEPLVLFGYIAACAPKLHLLSAVLVLPQRQTPLVAKQMAQVDILAQGKTRLGVGVGWNDVEYDALGMDFSTRGRRIAEQTILLRRLWTEDVVTFEGEFEHVRAVAVNPPPVQRPIPIWFGGEIEAARRRAVVLGDGLVMKWPLPENPLESEWPDMLEEMRSWRRDAGHSDEPGFEARFEADLSLDPEQWKATAEAWRSLGVSHLAVRTLRLGLSNVEEHLQRFALAREALGDLIEG
jgi:probable F420-dependent oxidoreductase